jgi:hypothetical protein
LAHSSAHFWQASPQREKASMSARLSRALASSSQACAQTFTLLRYKFCVRRGYAELLYFLGEFLDEGLLILIFATIERLEWLFDEL